MEYPKFTWLANSPWTASGYGVQTKLFLPRFKELGYDPACIAYFGLEGGQIVMNGIPIYPKFFDPYGQDCSFAHTQNWCGPTAPKVMFSYMDVWVFTATGGPGFHWIPWYPVDHDPMPFPVQLKLAQSWRRIAISKFAVEKSQERGLECYYVPNAVDTKAFKPMDKKEARKSLGLPEDAYLVGTVAMNKGQPSRKSFPQMMEAFAKFKLRHTDAVYVLHTTISEHNENGGINMREMATNYGLVVGKDVMFPDQYMLMMGYPDDYMARFYSSLDVHLLASMGEGFGVPIIEAQACGCPVIVGDWTSMGELCFSGVKISKKDTVPFRTSLASNQFVVNPNAVLNALEQERKHPSPGLKGREAIVAEYDVDVVLNKYWKPVLEDIQVKLKEEMDAQKAVAL